MTYNDMPVIIPLLATGYLLTIYLLLILAQRTIKSSRYVADSVTDAYASYVPTKQAPLTDDVEQRSRTVQRAPIGRWTKTESNSSASSSTATALMPPFREPLPFGRGLAQRGTGNASASLTLTEKTTFGGTATPNRSTEPEPLQGTANANTPESDVILPSKSIKSEL